VSPLRDRHKVAEALRVLRNAAVQNGSRRAVGLGVLRVVVIAMLLELKATYARRRAEDWTLVLTAVMCECGVAALLDAPVHLVSKTVEMIGVAGSLHGCTFSQRRRTTVALFAFLCTMPYLERSSVGELLMLIDSALLGGAGNASRPWPGRLAPVGRG
jgi:hypothetical protein